MENNLYMAAELSDQLINEIKLFEEKLSSQLKKNVVIIAYEEGMENGI